MFPAISVESGYIYQADREQTLTEWPTKPLGRPVVGGILTARIWLLADRSPLPVRQVGLALGIEAGQPVLSLSALGVRSGPFPHSNVRNGRCASGSRTRDHVCSYTGSREVRQCGGVSFTF